MTSRMRLVSALAVALPALLAGAASAGPLEVVATTTDLGALVREVGGEEVSLTVLTRGPQDPHFVEPRPSFIRKLHDADLFVQIGMDLEIGWAPVLLRSARNPDVQIGGRGYLDASSAIAALEVPTGPVDRSMGDVHPYGNPHYLTDPVNGWRVAALIRDRLTARRPEAAAGFRERFRDLERRLATALLGEALVAEGEPGALLARLERGELDGAGELGGWLGAMRPHAGTLAVQDHRLWPYFARRFGLDMVETLEPRPGIAPTTRHLEHVVARIRAESIPLLLSSPYFDRRHARWVAKRTGVGVAEMAHQPGAREGTEGDYLGTVDHNVRAVLEAL